MLLEDRETVEAILVPVFSDYLELRKQTSHCLGVRKNGTELLTAHLGKTELKAGLGVKRSSQALSLNRNRRQAWKVPSKTLLFHRGSPPWKSGVTSSGPTK